MEHIKVSSVSEAWRAAARIFPTDYEKNEERMGMRTRSRKNRTHGRYAEKSLTV